MIKNSHGLFTCQKMTDPSPWLTYYTEISRFLKFSLKKKKMPVSRQKHSTQPQFLLTLHNFILHASAKPGWGDSASWPPMHRSAYTIGANLIIRLSCWLLCTTLEPGKSKMSKMWLYLLGAAWKSLRQSKPRRWLQSELSHLEELWWELERHLIPLSAKKQET